MDIERFKMHKDRPTPVDANMTSVGYTLRGKTVAEDRMDADECLAKQVTNDDTGITQYYIRFSVSSGDVYDPDGDEDSTRSRQWTDKGRFPFRQVGREAFRLYLRFLQTGNQAYKRQAGREQ